MSSQWDEPVHPAGWAVNGDRGAFYDSHENCIHTLLNPGWWQVDLGRPYPLHSFTVWARDNGLVRRMADCVITVDGKFCYRFPEDTSDFPLRIDFNCTSGVINGSVVKVYKDSTAEDMDFVINFCEFEAWKCEGGTYGENCGETCGTCYDGAPCHHVTGHCQKCEKSLELPFCRAEPVISQANVGIVAGAAVGVLILSILAGVLALYIKKIRQRRRAGEYQPETAVLGADVVCTRHIDYDNHGYSNNGGDKKHVLGEDLHPEIKPNGTAHTTTNGDAFWHGSDSDEGKQSPDPLQLSSLSSNGDDNEELDTVMSLLEVDSDTGEGRETAENEAHDGSDVYMTPEAAGLRLDSIPQSLLGKLRGSEKLPFGLQKEHDCGSKEENQHSNRFDSIIPYDATRVVLHGDPPSDFSDYINASYIRGYWSWKTYIATQGPMANTVEEFWKMVLQERVTQIVMLTNVQEGDKTYGSVQVTTVDVQKRADYFIRTFDISGSGSYSSRQVTQYHYVTWPVHSVPNVTAGVGRTGLFIGLDIAMNHAENESQVDIFHIVERMREDRCNMVQTKAQYRFLHMVALEACISRATRVPLVGFDTFFPTHIDPAQSNQKIDAEFEMLTQTKVLMRKHPHTEALKEENIDKNRNHEVLPADRHLVSLTDDIKGRNQYINAVFVKTLFANRGCILTQLPLPHTLIDIWRLVTGYDVNTIVSLGSEVLGPEKNCCYWPREQKHPMKFGPFAVTLLSKEQLGEHLTSYSIQLKSKGTSKSREVTLLHYSGWSGELPASTPDVISLVDMMTSQSMDEEKHPVVVQCM
ncbi:hypothetical protein BaRGS_00032265 [Batillaria attramentaria]|uniref:Uncharacterized protein n=1 Tax=Batillaria attramentaria TaxID=370345 RepID=A0ABD0JNL6_9CAEN